MIFEILLMVDPGIGCQSMALLSGVGARYGHSPLLVRLG